MMKANDEAIQKAKADLESAIKGHDWYYAFSDDRRVFSAGQTRADQISRLFETCKSVAGEETAVAIWNSAAPADFRKKAVK